MRKNFFILAVLSMILGIFSMGMAFAGEEDTPATTETTVKEFTTKDIKEAMATLIEAASSELPENEYFKSPEDIHTFINQIIEEADDNTKATTCLSEILRALAAADEIDFDNFPKELIKEMIKTIRLDFHEGQEKLTHLIDKKPKKLASTKSSWRGLATGDMLIIGRFLLALKASQLLDTDTTFKQDFKAHFPNASELYAISPELKKFVKANSKKLKLLRKNSDALNKYQYDDMFELVFDGQLDEAIKHASKNILEEDDTFISLYFLQALAGLGIEEAIEELDTVIASLKEDKPKVAQFIQNDFFREYAILYGKGSKKKGSPKEDTEESSAKPAPSMPEIPKKADAPKEEDTPKKVDTPKNVDTPKKVDAPKKEDAPKVRAIEAGPIWGGYDAEIKCPKTCKGDNLWHKKEWWTTIGGRMSVCNCIVKD